MVLLSGPSGDETQLGRSHLRRHGRELFPDTLPEFKKFEYEHHDYPEGIDERIRDQ